MRTHSVESLILAVDTVAKGSVIRKEMSYDRALSTLVLFSCHSSKMLPMRQFFESVLTDQDQCEMYMPEEASSLLKRWGGISKEIYAGALDFEVDGEHIKFEVMKVMITILNSRKEDRCLVKSIIVCRLVSQTSNKQNDASSLQYYATLVREKHSTIRVFWRS